MKELHTPSSRLFLSCSLRVLSPYAVYGHLGWAGFGLPIALLQLRTKLSNLLLQFGGMLFLQPPTTATLRQALAQYFVQVLVGKLGRLPTCIDDDSRK